MMPYLKTLLGNRPVDGKLFASVTRKYSSYKEEVKVDITKIRRVSVMKKLKYSVVDSSHLRQEKQAQYATIALLFAKTSSAADARIVHAFHENYVVSNLPNNNFVCDAKVFCISEHEKILEIHFLNC